MDLRDCAAWRLCRVSLAGGYVAAGGALWLVLTVLSPRVQRPRVHSLSVHSLSE